MSKVDEILKKNLGSVFAENAGLVKKVKVNPYRAVAESVILRKANRLAEENKKLKNTINEIIRYSINK